ncbi:hypothetical protein [Brevibacterium jeotgali]|uniref:Uncharacterized protein n=1 Tax=Brevibacterium jeotgali TaxID=1262550 RepID=A0A2H1L4S2_9MICO|nr:hypothetical protein [Brevibacterium jeotgali]TWC01648.1 hypothetical protein FB108_0300 [Brevibacterium jeotgali]SMY11393.1 hypothetical protein BJEO58_00978 [Brevibacterium jeotgali]
MTESTGPEAAAGSAASAAAGAPAPSVAWPVRVTHDRAIAWLRRRVPGAAAVRAQLYHHPMLATSYEVRKRDGSASAHALVDLVGGRAYATEPWEHVAFVPLAEAEAACAAAISDPVRVLDDERGERAARDLVRSVLLRGRRLGPPGQLHPLREPLLFGKPNWWLTATKDGRPVEIILDGLTGRHYALTA